MLRFHTTVFVLLIATVSQTIFAQSPALTVTNGTVRGKLAEQIDMRLNELAEKDFSGVVLVALRDRVILSKGYGFADRERKVPYTTETVFDIGSITKPFTASAILKLESEGSLNVSDPIQKYLDGVPSDKEGITIHHLLTHTGGFQDVLGDDYHKIGRKEFVELALASELLSAPGEAYSYSNVGYSLLGAIIERVSGISYGQYLHEHLFRPSEMVKTGYTIPNWGSTELARGYHKQKDWGTPLDHAWAKDGPYWHLRANGGLLSTASDLYRWAVVLQENNVLDAAAKAKQFKSHVREGQWEGNRYVGYDTYYGYGWAIDEAREEHTVWSHNGSNGIFFADFRIYPKDQMVLILATNATGLRYESELDNITKLMLKGSKE